ncbi:hypothetical protein CAP36_15100 [Chitinophagaceae bacterium IBVUCB2]|nr:hypothetical protein CAP36_15100 [Chitinophagaceae bacterium IBVUCB2]
MYTRQEASLINKKFWTSFGMYMKPVASASGETVNWLNYKTGIKHIFFRMDVDKSKASVAIELRHPDKLIQQYFYEQLVTLKKMLEQMVGEKWAWQMHLEDEDGAIVSRIDKTITGVNVFNENDWPAIISFLKPRIIALDEFWYTAKDILE